MFTRIYISWVLLSFFWLASTEKVSLQRSKETGRFQTSIVVRDAKVEGALDLAGGMILVDCCWEETCKEGDAPVAERYLNLTRYDGEKVVVRNKSEVVLFGGVKKNIELWCYVEGKENTFGLGPGSLVISEMFNGTQLSLSFEETGGFLEFQKNSNQSLGFFSSDLGYSVLVQSLAFGNETVLESLNFTFDSLSSYSYLSVSHYFHLVSQLKSFDPLRKNDFGICFNAKNLSLPNITVSFSPSSSIIWTPSQYLFNASSGLSCLGIFPSFDNRFGLNFLANKNISFNFESSLMSISELQVKAAPTGNEPNHSSGSALSQSSQKPPGQDEKKTTKHKTQNSLIFIICIVVICAQIAAGYYFLSRSRKSRLQEPNEASQLELSSRNI